MTVAATVIADEAGLAQLAPEWDALAAAVGEPIASPAWILAWWRHVAPDDAQPRVVAVRDRDALIGVAPFYVRGEAAAATYRPMADDFSSNVALLAARDRIWDVAAATATALAEAAPRPAALALAPLSAGAPWAAAFADTWPGRLRPRTVRLRQEDTATVAIDGDFDGWLARRGAQFRKAVRKRARAFERAGGRMRLATRATIERDVAAFVELHAARWDGRGESRLLALGDRLPRLLLDIAGGVAGEERLRLWIAEIDGQPIGADLSLVAGGEIVGVNTGWDEAWRRLAPVQLLTVHKLQDAFARGEGRLHMGWGSLSYKRAFADGNDPVAWDLLLPVGRDLPRAAGRAAPAIVRARARDGLTRALPPERTEQLLALRRRVLARRQRPRP